MEPPLRKRKRPYTEDELKYINTHFKPEKREKLINDFDEFDLPAVRKLENEIEETFKIIEGKPLALYKKFINLTDRFNDLYKKYSPCRKGCGCCCKIPVIVSEMEKNIIKNYLDETNEIRNYAYFKYPNEPKFVNGVWGGNYFGKICPFLDNNECKIYSVRPYRCRRYISIDDECVSKFEKSYKTGSKEIIDTVIHFYSEIYYENIINYYCRKRKILNIRLNDIRDFFRKL
jgi:Fe-S-cluster containining protein